MKNKRIRFDDKFYFTFFDVLLLLCSLLLIFNFSWPILGYIILIVLFSLCLSGLYMFPRMGLYFNYRLGAIKYLGPHKIKKRKIKMNEIIKIDFIEIHAPKSDGMPPRNYMAYYDTVNKIYRNGKVYKFIIYLKSNDIIEVPYYNLFKARSKKRVVEQEEKINNIVKEFNLFRVNK